MTLRLVAIAVLVVTTGDVVAAPLIAPQAGGYAITGPSWRASVGADGAFTSLQVGGREFLFSRGGFPRGGYAYQDGALVLPEVAGQGSRLVAKSDKVVLTYEFADTSLDLSVQNLTDKDMLFVIVMSKDVTVVRGEEGKYRRTPLGMDYREVTWFALPGRVGMTGLRRIWGPWSDGYQVCEALIRAGQTGRTVFDLGLATPEETAKVEAAMNRVIEPPTDPTGPMWDLNRFGQAPAYEPATGYDWAETADGVQPIFLEGPPFEGEPTKVFAWLGIPPHAPEVKLPGMVLIHGGGGTAFAHWVKMWNDRGYAAIAMDTCGCVPVGSYGNWERHPQGGPPGWGGWDQTDWPREDQWTFHAIADVMLAHSLLRSLPEVDADRIGVTGISWGGYLTSLTAGVDPRYRFAAPVYGCGFTLDMSFGDSVRGLQPEQRDRWMRWWDPAAYLKDAAMPILWINGTNDFAYTMNGWQKSYREPTGPRYLSLRIAMPHGHNEGEAPEEIHAFADQILKGEPGLCRVTGQGRDGGDAWVTFDAPVAIAKAELCYTTDDGKWTERKWRAVPGEMTPGRATAALPEGTKCYYLNLTDERGLIISSEHEELP